MSQDDRSDILDSAPREIDPAFLFPLFLGAHFHQLMQPQNRPAHSLKGELRI